MLRRQSITCLAKTSSRERSRSSLLASQMLRHQNLGMTLLLSERDPPVEVEEAEAVDAVDVLQAADQPNLVMRPLLLRRHLLRKYFL